MVITFAFERWYMRRRLQPICHWLQAHSAQFTGFHSRLCISRLCDEIWKDTHIRIVAPTIVLDMFWISFVLLVCDFFSSILTRWWIHMTREDHHRRRLHRRYQVHIVSFELLLLPVWLAALLSSHPAQAFQSISLHWFFPVVCLASRETPQGSQLQRPVADLRINCFRCRTWFYYH